MPERLRVLLLSTSYPLRSASSSGIFVRRLADALGNLCDVTVLCPADDVSEPFEAGNLVKLAPFRYAPRRWQRLAQTPGGSGGADPFSLLQNLGPMMEKVLDLCE